MEASSSNSYSWVFSSPLIITRRSLLDQGWLQSGDLFRHLILLASVALFTLYIGLTYEIENFKGLQHVTSEEKASHITALLNELPKSAQNKAIAQLLILLPIDLVGIALNSSLFALIGICSLDKSGWTGRNLKTTQTTVYLFGITIAWHFTMISWWILYAMFEDGMGSIQSYGSDVLFHITYIVIEIVLLAVNHLLYKRKIGMNRSSLLANHSIASYSAILLSLYIIRLGEYSGRFIKILSQ